MKAIIIASILIIVSISSYSQDFAEYRNLIIKGDSAYDKKDYSSGIRYYSKAISLNASLKPVKWYRSLYNQSCLYALNGDRDHSISTLQEYLKFYRTRNEKPPEDLNHIFNDSDLESIRNEESFKNLLYNYYPREAVDFLSDKEVSYTALLKYIKYMETDDRGVEIKNKIIYYIKNDTSYEFNDKTFSLKIPENERLRERGISFINCNFKLHLVYFNSQRQTQVHPFEVFTFENCSFDGLVTLNLKFHSCPNFKNCTFNSTLVIDCETDNDYWGGFTIDSCQLKRVSIRIKSEVPLSFKFQNNISSDSSHLSLDLRKGVDRVSIDNNDFSRNKLIVSGDVNTLKIVDNKFNYLQMIRLKVGLELDLIRSYIKEKFAFEESYFSNDPSNEIDWKYIDSLKLSYRSEIGFNGGDSYVSSSIGRFGILRDVVPMDPNVNKIAKDKFVSGQNEMDYSDEYKFKKLMGTYSFFLNLYKTKNDIESYNSCFVTMKQLNSNRLKYLYSQNRSFQTFFRWKLSQLLKFYVNYGTDPARAIIISIYIIFVFGIFFFFFPSDWDASSKGQLIQNFKDFVQKNEKGYVKPFFILLGGFIISLLNALTLSLNAFITLGFGNIPTHGIARYVCVLEGFLGWFLLSIFTVAMINQVL